MDKEKRVHKITFVLIAIITIFVFSNMVIASAIPVNIVEPEVKEITNTKKVNSKIEPYRDIQISSKTGGIIDGVNVSTGQFVEKGQPLMIFEQDNIEIQIEQAEAALEIAKANHKKMKDGATDEQIKTAKAGVKQAAASLKIARANYEMLKEGAAEEDLKSLQAAYQQAVSSYEGAEKNLQLFESSYEDRIMDKQQLNSAETQLLSAEKQVEVAEERLEQAKIGLKQAENGLRQAENEYERIKYLYEENVVTKKQYEMTENQYENAQSAVENSRSAVESARIAQEQAEVSYQSAAENYSLTKDSHDKPIQLEQQLASARTQLKVAEANKKIAKANLEKAEKGARVEELISGEGNVEQAEAALERAEAQLEQVMKDASDEDIRISESNLKQAESALNQARTAFEESIIKSPISGIVAQVNYDDGEMAGSGTPLLSIVNLEKVYIKTDISADLLVNINKGDIVEARVLAYDDYYLQGKIEYISPVADPRTQAFTVKILAENKDQKVRGGMFADVFFQTDQKEEALVIPIEAVQDINNNPHVYIVENKKSVLKKVRIGISNNTEVEIIEGIKKGDKVIVRGQNSVKDGSSIEVVR